MTDPHCFHCGHWSTDHVGWKHEPDHHYKVFSCCSCGKLTYVPWDHEKPR